MQTMELVFVYIIPSIFAVACVALVILLGVLKTLPTAWALLMAKLGLARRGKGYDMIAWDDRQLTTKQMDVHPEGAMEKKQKHGSLTFYLAKPQEDSPNITKNLQNEYRDRDVLPPYYLDGVLPVYFSHISKAIATNPKALTALRLANRVDAEAPKQFDAEIMLPEPATLPNGGVTQVEEVTVLLGFDPVDIKKNFASYWQQSNIDATKKRHQNIGAEKEKRTAMDIVKMMIVATIFGIGMMVVAAFALGLIG